MNLSIYRLLNMPVPWEADKAALAAESGQVILIGLCSSLLPPPVPPVLNPHPLQPPTLQPPPPQFLIDRVAHYDVLEHLWLLMTHPEVRGGGGGAGGLNRLAKRHPKVT